MRAEKTPTGSLVHLSCGVIVGEPIDDDSYRATAKRLGYGSDTLAMCQDHDPLHVALCQWLGLPVSYSLTYATATGRFMGYHDQRLAEAEEAAVIAVQRFAQLAGVKVPG